MLETVLQYGTGKRRRDRPVRGRQDRHDLQLRRRLVRRLGLQVHGRRVGRLPQQADPDDHRLQRRPRARRHLPGADLARLHDLGAADRTRHAPNSGRETKSSGSAAERSARTVDDPRRRGPKPANDAVRQGRSRDAEHGQRRRRDPRRAQRHEAGARSCRRPNTPPRRRLPPPPRRQRPPPPAPATPRPAATPPSSATPSPTGGVAPAG